MTAKTNRPKSAKMTRRQMTFVVGLAVFVCLIFVMLIYLLIDYSMSIQSTDIASLPKANPTSRLTPRPTFPPTWTPTREASPAAKPKPTLTPETIQPTTPADTAALSCVVGTWKFDDLAPHLITLIPNFAHYGFELADYQGDVFVTFSTDGKVDIQADHFTAKMTSRYIDELFSMDGRATAIYTADDAGRVTLTNIDLVHLRFTHTRFYGDAVLEITDNLTNRVAAAAAGVEPTLTLRPFSATIAVDCSDRTIKYAPGVQPLRLERIGSANNTPAASCFVGTWSFKDAASIILMNTRYYDGAADIGSSQGRLTYTFSPNGKVLIKAERAVVTLDVVDKSMRGNHELEFSFNGQVSANYSITGTHTVVLSNVNSRGLTTKSIARLPIANRPPAIAQLSTQDEMTPFLGLIPFSGQSSITAMYQCNGDVLEYLPAWPLTLSRSDPH